MRNPIPILLCLAWAIGSGLMLPKADAEDFKIVAAENFYGGIAEQITGTRVFSILSNPNQDPHEFTTNASTARSVADADIVIYNGIGYDTWIEKLLATRGKPHRVVINVSSLIGARDGDNPHIWYAPQTMPALANKLTEVLSRNNPAQAEACQKRLETFIASMKPELDKIAQIKATFAGTPVTATEPVFGYMADALGFKMLNYTFQVKIMNDSEPGADETATFEKSLSTQTIKILFYNNQVTDPTTSRLQELAGKSGVPVVGVTETQPSDEKSYVSWMMHELEKVQDALKPSE